MYIEQRIWSSSKMSNLQHSADSKSQSHELQLSQVDINTRDSMHGCTFAELFGFQFGFCLKEEVSWRLGLR